MKRTFLIILFLGLIIACGFIREFVFVNTNSILYSKLYNNKYYFNNNFSFLNSQSYTFVYVSKWVFTGFFIVLYFFLQYLFIKQILKNTETCKWLLYLYIILIVLAAVFFFAGWILGNINKGYTYSRIFLGLLQSPLPLMFLIPVHYFRDKINSLK